VVAWIILNTIGAIKHWDPYPFILLNLAFSTQAAYAAPLILLAQNRQDDRDRANIERDREVAARTQADTEFLARELAAVRLALADMVTTQDLEDSMSRLAKLIADQPLPDGHGPLAPSDRELPPNGVRLRATAIDGRNLFPLLRHAFVSVMTESGVAVEVITRLAGHSSSRTTKTIYRPELRPVIITGADVMDKIFI
jgi:hypothetical protein